MILCRNEGGFVHKYTEGPWVWFNGSLVTCKQDRSIPLNSKVIMYCPSIFGNLIEKPNVNNAFLIESAPELLKLLKLVIKYVDNTQNEMIQILISEAIQTIDRAEGKLN